MPDLIVTDVNMPEHERLQLTRRLRADHRTARVPIVMLSARKRATTSSPAMPRAPTGTSRTGRDVGARSEDRGAHQAHEGDGRRRDQARTVLVFLRGKSGAGA
jgi:CheY-like chemotaxis protein